MAAILAGALLMLLLWILSGYLPGKNITRP